MVNSNVFKKITAELTPIEFFLFIMAPLMGIALRFYLLEINGFWIDELATIYFAENLDIVFLKETHTPLYYFLMKPFLSIFGRDLFALKAVTASISVLLLTFAVYLSSKVFCKRGVALFTLLVFLCPLDIVAARMFRQYSIFFELSLILLLLSKNSEIKFCSKFGLSLFLSFLHPFGLILPLALGVEEIFSNRKLTKSGLLYFSSVCPIFLYYLSKRFFLSGKALYTGYPGGGEKVFNLLEDSLLVFLGEHYPRINIFPVPYSYIYPLGSVIGLILIYALFKFNRSENRNPFFIQAIILTVTAVIFTEVFSYLFINVKMGRYLVFLMAPIILNTVYLCQNFKWASSFFFFLHLPVIIGINPFMKYPGEREVFNEYVEYKKSYPDTTLVICANVYQFNYYFNSPERPCMETYAAVKGKGRIFFVDMNGYGRHHLFKIAEDYSLSDVQTFNSISTIALGVLK